LTRRIWTRSQFVSVPDPYLLDFFFFFQAEDGIRDGHVTGVQTCALPILLDEPTAGVDPKARRDFWEQIHQLAAQALTFLITTHYMDEAERCQRLAYISKGRLLAAGTVDEVISRVGLTTWSVRGRDLAQLAEQLRKTPGVQQAVAFGNSLHVSSTDAAALERAIAPFRHEPYDWRQIPSGLEDAFISLMEHDKSAA